MRFWNRKERVTTDSGRVKSTQPHQKNHKQFDSPTIRPRRPFSSWLSDEEVAEKIPSITTMDLLDADPIDPSRGGRDQVSGVSKRSGLPPYTISNLTTDRTYDANSTSVAELADVLGTLIGDAQKTFREMDRRLKNAGA